MTNCEEFIKYVEQMNEKEKMNEEAERFFNVLKNSQDKFVVKNELSDIAKTILSYLKTKPEVSMKSSEIGEALEMTSRRVSGSMNKLVKMELVEKIGEKPISYMISTKGLEYEIEGDRK